ncbi:MarR family winged helix-turn-helix transcriptional regulator [Picrophilus oshimae]|uniref:DNA-binding transcriptional regulator, MarR family n=1 Tax=Picrophilus torridus (strain ATCC 700027 / DSM 9790 / JCM 10055 / NBRC 100828 / KAW 2/3) TaxID=1122961 RepID=Q6L076_PICTO|nr:MarR family transcriptional regulator [Picrophilus oshimae]AAT43626.1 hypothetical transcriptional regulator, MarR family [Picrophilus oshimae DSM 9789]SMD31254.1 DNA-binding transcriptional regulator, MarR family [Picrophilus oshimae DSM 9789]
MDTDTIWQRLEEIINNIKNSLNNILLRYNINLTDYKVLIAIKSGNDSMSKIAERLNLAPGWVTDIADRLEKAGYIERKRYEHDRRIINIELTENGRMAVHKIRKDLKYLLDYTFSDMSNEELVEFYEMLNKIKLR